MNILGGLKYALYQYGIIVQRDAREEFLYDIAPPLGRGGDHRVIDLLSYIDFDSFSDAAEQYPGLDEGNPVINVDPDSDLALNVVFTGNPRYNHLAGNTFVSIVSPGYIMFVRLDALDDTMLTEPVGFVDLFVEISDYPYSSVALEPFDEEGKFVDRGYHEITISVGAKGFSVNSAISHITNVFRQNTGGNKKYFRFIGFTHEGPAGSKFRLSIEIPKLNGESAWTGGIFGPGVI